MFAFEDLIKTIFFRLKLAEKNRQTRRRPGSRAAAARGVVGGSSGGLTVPGSFGSPGSGGSAGGVGGGPLTRRKSAGVRVRSLIDKMLGGDSKSKSCDDLHVL